MSQLIQLSLSFFPYTLSLTSFMLFSRSGFSSFSQLRDGHTNR